MQNKHGDILTLIDGRIVIFIFYSSISKAMYCQTSTHKFEYINEEDVYKEHVWKTLS